VHLGEDLLGEGLRDAVEVDLAAGLADALGLGLGELLDVAIGGILEGGVLVVGCGKMLKTRLDFSSIDRPLNPLIASRWGWGDLTKRIAILGAIATDVWMSKTCECCCSCSGGVTGWRQVGNNRRGAVE
jgi:hypothetical protein